jgi:DNA-binding transcriptional ArsR family regulator
MTLAAVAQHLRVLEECGIISTYKVGRERTCKLEPAGLNVAAQWLAARGVDQNLVVPIRGQDTEV